MTRAVSKLARRAYSRCIAFAANAKYASIARKLRRSLRADHGRKISVWFLVNDNAKWNAQSVHDAMKANPRFEPNILVCRQEQTEDEKKTRTGFADDCSFFDERGIRYVKGYDEATGRDLSVLDFSPDVVFYCQPWGYADGLNDIKTVARKALTCYIPYSIPLCNDPNDNGLTFHLLLWRFFLPSPVSSRINRAAMANAGRNCAVTGYPKLDEYRAAGERDTSHFKRSAEAKAKIIYAPHHSFANRLSFATFEWNGRELLEYARSHPETSWVFKPHPRLRYELVATGMMTLAEANDYYASWDALPNASVYAQGDYIGLFAESSLLVTDSVSFLGEYLPSGNPVILLENPRSAGYNELGEAITAHYYRASDIDALRTSLDSVAISGIDGMRDARLKDSDAIFPREITAAGKILDIVSSALLEKD